MAAQTRCILCGKNLVFDTAIGFMGRWVHPEGFDSCNTGDTNRFKKILEDVPLLEKEAADGGTEEES